MTAPRPVRVLWLLNHSTLRQFELEQLRKLGITEVYIPKRFPLDDANLSADVDYSYDATLTLSADELLLLNAQDWYGEIDPLAWELANRTFDIAIIGLFPAQITSVSRNFTGAVVLRAFGLPNGVTYTQTLFQIIGPTGVRRLEQLGQRFWFGSGYEHLAEVEGDFLRRRNLHLPVEQSRGDVPFKTWRDSFGRIVAAKAAWTADPTPLRAATRILVLLPVGYRGGSLRGALLLAQALLEGSRAAGTPATIVFAHLDDSQLYPPSEFEGLPVEIERRAFTWREMSARQAQRAMRYSGVSDWQPQSPHYMSPDDGMQQFADCDLWVIVSDRLERPILPLRPVVLMVYDYIQRYVSFLPNGIDQPYLEAARAADRVMITTDFTERDALQYAGIAPSKLAKVPMLVPSFPPPPRRVEPDEAYFVWTTNSAVHKNHLNAVKALQCYYEECGGQLLCFVTGHGTSDLFGPRFPHLVPVRALVSGSRKLQQNVRLMGELEDRVYRRTLAGASFLWHAAQIDNGTFSVIEAAMFGVPAISTDYPPMREIDKTFGLQLCWMPFDQPEEMARLLKLMEDQVRDGRRPQASTRLIREKSDVAAAGPAYWSVVSGLL